MNSRKKRSPLIRAEKLALFEALRFSEILAPPARSPQDLQWSTLVRIFRALNCDALVVARALKTPKDAVRERVKETARRNVLRVTGTMALERQTPDDEAISALIRSEEKRLLARPSSEMWKDG